MKYLGLPVNHCSFFIVIWLFNYLSIINISELINDFGLEFYSKVWRQLIQLHKYIFSKSKFRSRCGYRSVFRKLLRFFKPTLIESTSLTFSLSLSRLFSRKAANTSVDFQLWWKFGKFLPLVSSKPPTNMCNHINIFKFLLSTKIDSPLTTLVKVLLSNFTKTSNHFARLHKAILL